MDLKATARSNSATREAAADGVVAADSSGLLSAFRHFAATAAFSTNVAAFKIRHYEAAGVLIDTRRVFVAEHGGDATAGLAAFEAGSWATRRTAFEDIWDRGRELVYGALNAGGMGAEGDYGPFCVVVADPGDPPVLAVFPEDSAQRYVDAAGSADAVRAAVEATAWADRGDLVVIERGTEVTSDTAAWADLVCRPGRYFEITVAPGPPIAQVTAVRLRGAHARRLVELQARSVAGEPLTAIERSEVAAYDVIQSWRKRFRTLVEEVD